MSLISALRRNTERAPSALAIRSSSGDLDWLAFSRLVQSLISLISSRSLLPGQRIAYHGWNHPIAAALPFAASATQTVYMPLPPTMSHDQVVSMMRKSSFALLFAEGIAGAVSPLSIQDLSSDETPVGQEAGAVTGVNRDFIEFMTSGSTGEPKTVVLSEAAILANAEASIQLHDLKASDRALVSLSLCQSGGLGIQSLPTLLSGGALLLLERFFVSKFVDWLQREKPTLALTVPSHMRLLKLSAKWEEIEFSGLRHLSIGSQVVDAALGRELLTKGARLTNVYGLTEAGPCALARTFLKPEEISESSILSIGHACRGMDVRLSEGTHGEIQLRGPGLFTGYRNSQGQIESGRDDQGWFHTGDLGSMVGTEIVCEGRRSESLKIGGLLVQPGDIERVLRNRFDFSDCMVIARRHSVFGEILVAVIETRGQKHPSAREIISACKSELDRHKVPREVVFLDVFPRSSVGKPLRKEIQKLLDSRG